MYTLHSQRMLNLENIVDDIIGKILEAIHPRKALVHAGLGLPREAPLRVRSLIVLLKKCLDLCHPLFISPGTFDIPQFVEQKKTLVFFSEKFPGL